MPSWKHYLHSISLLSIMGFALVIVSGFWRIVAVLLFLAIAILVIRYRFRR